MDASNGQDGGADLFAMSRTADPGTSRVAAMNMVRTSTVAKHEGQIMEAVIAYPGSTPRELAEPAGLRHDQVWRRISKMDDKKWVERRGRRGGQQRIWPLQEGERACGHQT